MEWDGWSNAIIAILTFVLLLFSSWKGWKEVNFRSATKNLHTSCQDEDKMGYFVVSFPWYRHLFPPWMSSVKPPRIPSLRTIIKHGDLGIFTASIMDSLKRGHCDVSWRPLYEQFFRECAWAMDYNPKVRELLENVFNEKSGLREYLKQAEFDIWMARRCAEGKVKGDQLPEPHRGCTHIPFWKFWLYRHNLKEQLYYCRSLSSGPRILRPLTERIASMDRHFLYYRWQVERCQHETNAVRQHHATVGPLLVSSAIPLEHDPVTKKTIAEFKQHHQNRHHHIALQSDTTNISNHEGSPAVRVSEEELAALSFMLGIEIKSGDEQFLPGGRGGFGTCLTSNKFKGKSVLRLIQHVDHPQFSNARGGSRYSILFAKHLACGCIPFERWHDHEVQTLVVTEKVQDIIQEGGSICDTVDKTKTSDFRWTNPEIQYLSHMPAFGNGGNFYHMNRSHPGFKPSLPGTIWANCTQTERHFSITTWPEVIARLAFGGLVPMATRPLAEAVRFSVGGASHSSGDMEALEKLMRRVQEVIHDEPDCWIPMFGERFKEQCRKKRKDVNVDFTSQAAGVFDQEMSDIVRHFGQYTTLLEALLARTDEVPPGGAGGNANDTDSFTTATSGSVDRQQGATAEEENILEHERRIREKVYKACVNQIKETYKTAVEWEGRKKAGTANAPFLLSTTTSLGTSHKNLAGREEGDIIQTVELSRWRLSMEQCATVARCLIQAWTSFVRIVDWNDNDPAGRDGSRPSYHPVSLAELPDVAAWE
ncbi:hypothetical protein QBC34DRAFT_211136 [Podospora aff. communis PSN243]|uniref:Uncharacterized protein n=1 Tax=Podospora aff. communis PSN243 TaxID=3040156 RepID=A0AAV9G5P5_9PEZI|nr:hypothetical protein QBC34DRAFT_211136 [Podospora aff. communis PSN243]